MTAYTCKKSNQFGCCSTSAVADTSAPIPGILDTALPAVSILIGVSIANLTC